MDKNRLSLLKKIKTAPTGTVLSYDRRHDRFVRYHSRVTREINTQQDLTDKTKRILVLGELK